MGVAALFDGPQHRLERRGESGIVHPRLGVVDRRVHPGVDQQMTIGQSGERRWKGLVVGGGASSHRTSRTPARAGATRASPSTELVLGDPRPRRLQGGGVAVGAVAQHLGQGAQPVGEPGAQQARCAGGERAGPALRP